MRSSNLHRVSTKPHPSICDRLRPIPLGRGGEHAALCLLPYFLHTAFSRPYDCGAVRLMRWRQRGKNLRHYWVTIICYITVCSGLELVNRRPCSCTLLSSRGSCVRACVRRKGEEDKWIHGSQEEEAVKGAAEIKRGGPRLTWLKAVWGTGRKKTLTLRSDLFLISVFLIWINKTQVADHKYSAYQYILKKKTLKHRHLAGKHSLLHFFFKNKNCKM